MNELYAPKSSCKLPSLFKNLRVYMTLKQEHCVKLKTKQNKTKQKNLLNIHTL